VQQLCATEAVDLRRYRTDSSEKSVTLTKQHGVSMFAENLLYVRPRRNGHSKKQISKKRSRRP
jgi:hypothetical protein